MTASGGRGWSRRRLLTLVAFLVLVALAGCGESRPAPAVCYGCTDGGATQALPPDADTDSGVTHLYVDPGTTPRVEARTTVDPATADELCRNASRRQAVLTAMLSARSTAVTAEPGEEGPTPTYESDDGLPGYPVPAFADRDAAVAVDDGELVVAFEIAGVPDEDPEDPAPALADRGLGGAVLVDRFDVRDGRNPHPLNDEPFTYGLATDRLVVHAPPGTRPVVAPENATVYEDRVVLESLPADTSLVFAPPGTGGTLAAHATLTADALGWVVPDSFWVALLPTLQFSLLLGGLRAGREGGTRYAAGVLLLALLLTLGPLALLLGPLGIVGAGAVLLAAGYLLWRGARAEKGTDDDGSDGTGSDDGRLPSLAALRAGVASWMLPVAGAVAVAAVLTVAAAATTGGPVSRLLFLGGGLLPLIATAGLGRLDAVGTDGPRPRQLLTLAVLVAPWLLAVGHVSGRGLPDGLEATVLVLVWGTGITLVGFLAHQVARRTA